MVDQTSVLCGNMPQHNYEEGGKQPSLSFSPAASVWGQMDNDDVFYLFLQKQKIGFRVYENG
jgi:hypothetical protein